MAETKPIPPPRPTTTSANASNVSVASGLRSRFATRNDSGNTVSPTRKRPEIQQQASSTRNGTLDPPPPDLLRRRSSILSDTTQSLDEIINPSSSKRGSSGDDSEVTHWHSIPIAFALLPAVGGLFFQNGSGFVTDVLLLTLAGVFMNWSIRIPWDWYYSAQALRRDIEPSPDPSCDSIPEEPDDTAVDTASSEADSPRQQPADSKNGKRANYVSKRDEAAADLRIQELLAFAATFIFPALAAYLLHVLRGQLSRPSNSLVSDYNLSIFLLAAEIRPARQLVRLIANRTLHLQRTVTGLDDPFAAAFEDKSTIRSLETRIADLEAKLTRHAVLPPNLAVAQKADVTELSAEMRKRYEPRLDSLERAMRRYEKRMTTMAMLIEQRLNSLETRLQDALSLAAVAAQHSQHRGTIFAYILQTLSLLIAWPLRIAWILCVWPFHVLEEGYGWLRTMMLGPMPEGSKQAMRRQGSREGTADEKPRVKGSTGRKVSR
ncbi:hypothetical protein BAUCODRAFT_68599 [Baudoinia panamericana UAMH 10762]|uniref:Uncharacterized protein n=1 Tax=Baudoinia panamericana (strain UAMH 10762) TaxID=717646 RepID=M2NFE0_BAUPA|nr:uncharacterized protein BAUCODRAFT_68599 [Baudoinia panamericana UAMH 10762]EMC97705.1 hypothetical protein BAUCODRAFT_68599 [Baudoinia panamericana UAMH 10762]